MLLVNGREIPVAVVRSRRARRYVLRLRDDGLARLTIPRNGSAREAWEFAQRQRPWLERQLQYLAARPIRPKEWRVGIEILFRGEKVKVETIAGSHLAADHPANLIDGHGKPSADNSPSRASGCSVAKTDGEERRGLPRHSEATAGEGGRQSDFFPGLLPQADGLSDIPHSAFRIPHAEDVIRLGSEQISVPDSTADLRPAIENHLRILAAKELPARTLELAALHQLSVSRVTVRAQRSRWGSCSFKRVISLNWRLIQTPPFVSDYIILHELMHLRQMNHSARFWKEVQRACPDYRTAKRWLKENPGLLDR